MQSTCVWCEKEYDTKDSTATTDNNKNLYCSEECEAIEEEFLTEGNKILDQAKKENPAAFMRTSMTPEQESAMQTFKHLGVRFKGSGPNLSESPKPSEDKTDA